MDVWLVWLGKWEATLEDIWENEADARRHAHELRREYGDEVTVEEREVRT